MGIYDRFVDGALVNYSASKTIIYRFYIAGNITKIASHTMTRKRQRLQMRTRKLSGPFLILC